jgi:sortase (surface protein transpeptidase)
MRRIRPRPTASRRLLAVTVVTGLLAAAGAACIGVAVTHQQQPPKPPESAVRSPAAPPDVVPTTASTPKPVTAVVGPVLAASRPVSLTIPAIGVKAPLQRLGQTADGSLEVPAPGPKYDYPGWYRYSPTPGSLGPSVIVGHVDSAANGPSVFWRLGNLRSRDTVRVARADGSVAVFVVDDVRRFRKARFPSRLVYGNTDHAALRLITCGGPLEGGHYRDNIIVLASLVRAAA